MLGYTPPGRHPLGRHPTGQTPLGQTPSMGRHLPGQTPLRSACWEIRPISGLYVSYWNAFLLVVRWLTWGMHGVPVNELSVPGVTDERIEDVDARDPVRRLWEEKDGEEASGGIEPRLVRQHQPDSGGKYLQTEREKIPISLAGNHHSELEIMKTL